MKKRIISASSHNTSLKTNNNGIGRIDVSSVPLPSYVKLQSGTYTYSGKVLIAYKTANDASTTDFVNLAVLNDDGTNFKKIFSGVIPTKAKANGIRYMPFKDNKRVLLGDYVLECTPDIDTCTSAKIVPVVFPASIDSDPMTEDRWSEVVIAPDNNHIAWTTLRTDFTAAALVGVLTRHTNNYVIEKAQIISTVSSFTNDPNNPGYIIPNTMLGGEVKQFVKGGNALSVVGQVNLNTPDSVVQYLNSLNLTQITNTPGYDETTIFSPDERLGMTMSTKFSTNTDPAIFGLMPRPYPAYTCTGLNTFLYTYSVTGVRSVRQGNIGPALIDINLSKNQAGYKGVNLNTDKNWVFCSPMSWNPDGKRAMWIEQLRGYSTMHLQKVKLLDYSPKKSVPVVTTTDNIPYGIKDLTVLSSLTKNAQGKIAGKRSGYISYTSTSNAKTYSGSTESQYVNFSDDGVNFYNGDEKIKYSYISETHYDANIKLTGKNPGVMNFRATFGPLNAAQPAKLLFDKDKDGNPKSYGYVKYNGVTLNISNLIP